MHNTVSDERNIIIGNQDIKYHFDNNYDLYKEYSKSSKELIQYYPGLNERDSVEYTAITILKLDAVLPNVLNRAEIDFDILDICRIFAEMVLGHEDSNDR